MAVVVGCSYRTSQLLRLLRGSSRDERDEENSAFIALVVVALVAAVGIGHAAVRFATQQSLANMMGRNRGRGMDMEGTASKVQVPALLEWTMLFRPTAFLATAVALRLRSREMAKTALIAVMSVTPRPESTPKIRPLLSSAAATPQVTPPPHSLRHPPFPD